MSGASTDRDGALRRLAVQEAATRALADTGNLAEAFEGILESVCLALDWQRAEAWIVDPTAGALALAAHWCTPGADDDAVEAVSRDTLVGRGEGLPGRVWESGAPIFVPDVSRDDPLLELGRATGSGARSAVACPIVVDGEVIGVMAFYTDTAAEPDEELLAMAGSAGRLMGHVVRRRQAEAAVRESEARKRAVLDAALDCIVTIDHRGIVVEVNRAAESCFGYTATEMIGRRMAELIIPPHLRERHAAGFAHYLATGEAVIIGHRVELEAMKKDGTVFPVEITVTRVEHDSTPYFTAYIRDIGGRRRADDRLRDEIRVNETLQRLALSFGTERDRDRLLQLITDTATVLSDAQIGAFFLNERGPDGGPEYTLYTLSGAEKNRFDGFQRPRKTPLFAPTFEGRSIVRLDDVRTDPRYGAMGPQPEGHPPVVSYLAVPVKAPSGVVLGGLFFGHAEPARFTQQHERVVAGIAAHAAVALENLRLYDKLRTSEQTAQTAYRMAADAARRKDEFIAMLSHELRNPLAPIMTAIELMKMDPSEETLGSSRVVIERQAKHMLRLVDDLLDISRITRGKVSLERRPVEIREVLASAVEMASPLFEKLAHRLHVDIEDGLWVRADRNRITQVASNLLTNAARYTNPGGDVWLTAFHADGQIEIHVRDSGIGMGPELLERVFEPFSQGAQEIDRAQGGLGLGLALVKTLTEAHGGTVEATSAGPGRGSELVVRLPVADSMDGIRPSLTPGRGVPAPAAGTRILVVDDNPDAAEVLARGLRRLGYQVGIAHDGPEALARAPELHPEIAILDIGLPVMDGYELGHRLRQLEGLDGLRLIAVTGYGQISDRMRSRAAGFDAHLVKPVGIEELAEALET